MLIMTSTLWRIGRLLSRNLMGLGLWRLLHALHPFHVMFHLAAFDDHGVRGIGTGKVVAIQDPVNLLPLGLPRREQVTDQNVADVVVEHVEVVEDVGYLWIPSRELRAQVGRQRHEGPLYRWLFEVPVVGGKDGPYHLLLRREV